MNAAANAMKERVEREKEINARGTPLFSIGEAGRVCTTPIKILLNCVRTLANESTLRLNLRLSLSL